MWLRATGRKGLRSRRFELLLQLLLILRNLLPRLPEKPRRNRGGGVGSAMAERAPWEEQRPDAPHVWRTLGYRRVEQEPGSGRNVIEWDASEDYAFPTAAGWVIHGGLV